MLLAIDIGNTNVTLGLFRAEPLVATRRAVTVARRTADEFEVLLDALLRLDDASLADVAAIAAASVVPALTGASRRSPRDAIDRCSMATRRDRAASRPGRPAGARSAPTAWSTRWRPRRLYGTPAVVVDFGTATTFDCVAADGAYVGGAIAPGLELGLEALAARTAKLPRIELRAPDRAIGRDTVSRDAGGTVFGYQALVGGLLARIRARARRLERRRPGRRPTRS